MVFPKLQLSYPNLGKKNFSESLSATTIHCDCGMTYVQYHELPYCIMVKNIFCSNLQMNLKKYYPAGGNLIQNWN